MAWSILYAIHVVITFNAKQSKQWNYISFCNTKDKNTTEEKSMQYCTFQDFALWLYGQETLCNLLNFLLYVISARLFYFPLYYTCDKLSFYIVDIIRLMTFSNVPFLDLNTMKCINLFMFHYSVLCYNNLSRFYLINRKIKHQISAY